MLGHPGAGHRAGALETHSTSGLGQTLPILLILLLPQREQTSAPLLLVAPLLPALLL